MEDNGNLTSDGNGYGTRRYVSQLYWCACQFFIRERYQYTILRSRKVPHWWPKNEKWERWVCGLWVVGCACRFSPPLLSLFVATLEFRFDNDKYLYHYRYWVFWALIVPKFTHLQVQVKEIRWSPTEENTQVVYRAACLEPVTDIVSEIPIDRKTYRLSNRKIKCLDFRKNALLLAGRGCDSTVPFPPAKSD